MGSRHRGLSKLITSISTVTLVVVVTAAQTSLAWAGAADFDKTFDGDGTLTIDSGGQEAATAVAVASDGKIVIAGRTSNGVGGSDAVVYRLNPDGSFDNGFDGDGRVGIDSGKAEGATALALQPDATGGGDHSKIVVAGRTSNGVAGTLDAVVYRLNSNGSLDNGFDGDGKLGIDSGGDEEAQALAVQPDGKIFVAGTTSNGVGGTDDAVVYRLNPDGSFDNSFAVDGKLGIDSGGDESANALAVQPDGKILIAGTTSNGVDGIDDAVVYRLNPDGSFDSTFDGDGRRGLDSGGLEEAEGLAVQPDGKILVAGDTSNGVNGTTDAVVYRLNSNGSLDNGFDGDGSLTIDSGGQEIGNAAALLPDGKILVAGDTTNGGGGSLDAVIYRLNPNGSLDDSFDVDGRLSIDDGGGDEIAFAIAVQSDGKIVISGSTTNGVGATQDAIVYRLLGAATPPPYQPDLLIRKGRGAYVGDDVYSADGTNEAINTSARRGQRQSFSLLLENDGTSSDVISVKGGGSSKGFSVQYLVDGQVVSNKRGQLSFKTVPALDSGGNRAIKVVVKITKKAAHNATKTLTIAATSTHGPSDAVKAVVTLNSKSF